MRHLAKVLYWHKPVPGVRIPPSPPFHLQSLSQSFPVTHHPPRNTLLLAALMAACQGPGLVLHSQGTCYVDGRVEKRARIPFRYYGTTAIDAVPAEPATDAATQFVPVRQTVAIDPPVAPWLFPFDFLGELAVRAFAGTADQVVHAAPVPADQAVVVGFTPSGLEDLRERADAARISR
jgi:hypothetical protein